jgi:hypothetical protein
VETIVSDIHHWLDGHRAQLENTFVPRKEL